MGLSAGVSPMMFEMSSNLDVITHYVTMKIFLLTFGFSLVGLPT